MQKVIVYTDGGARGNPGPAGAGVCIMDEKETLIKSVSRYLGRQTNNVAEYEAVILGLETLKKMFGAAKLQGLDIEFRMDSQLVARQLSHQYQVKEPTLFPQFMKIWNAQVKDFPKISFTHVRREQNGCADAMANEAMDRGS